MKKIVTTAKQNMFCILGILICIAIYAYFSTTRIAQSVFRYEIMIASVVAMVMAVISFVRFVNNKGRFKSIQFHLIGFLIALSVFICSNIFFLGNQFMYADDTISILIIGVFRFIVGIIRMPFVDMFLYTDPISNFEIYIVHFMVVYIALKQVLCQGKALMIGMKVKKAECNA